MQLNGTAINDEPVNGDPANYGRLKLGELADVINPVNDNGRLLVWDVTMTAELTLLQNVIADYLSGGSGPTIVTKLITDILATTDAGSFLSRFRNTIVTQNLSVLDFVLASKLRFGLTGESVVTLDLSPLSRYRGALFTDFTSVVEATIEQYWLARQFSEVISLTDQVIGQRVKPRQSTETITLDDTGRFLAWDVLVDASVDVIDQIVKSIVTGGGAITRVSSDTVIISDGTSRALIRNRALIEAVSMSEGGFGRSVETNATFSETIDVLDGFLANRLRRVVTSEGVTLIDLLISSASSTRTVTASDAILIGDQAVVSRLRGRTAADLIGLSDAQLHALARLLTLVEGVTFQDNQLKVRFYARRTTDQTDVADEAVKQVLYAVLYDVRSAIGWSTVELILGRDYVSTIGADAPVAHLGGYH